MLKPMRSNNYPVGNRIKLSIVFANVSGIATLTGKANGSRRFFSRFDRVENDRPTTRLVLERIAARSSKTRAMEDGF